MQLLKNNYDGLKELSHDESLEIIGGESAWYWIFYGIGQIGYYTKEFANSTREANAKHKLVGVK